MNDKLTHGPDAWLDDVRRWFYGGSPPEGDARPEDELVRLDGPDSSPAPCPPPANSTTRRATPASER